jgi:hypothetical protein
VFGLGLSLLVAPLTAAVLGAVDDREGGIASAVNNAVARLAGLLAVAALPLAAGIGGPTRPSGAASGGAAQVSAALGAGYARAMGLGAGLCAAAAVVAFATIRRAAPVKPTRHPSLQHGCVAQ